MRNKMTKELNTIEQPQETNLVSVIQQVALNPEADVDKLEKMLAMQERWEANQARKAFYGAMSNFQMELPPIVKKKQGHNYQYAPLCDITAIANPYLNKHGLSYRFEQSHENKEISVTCVITHVDGHSERTTMQGANDTSGSKNAIQAAGSTVQYLMRYTIIGALGITTADSDSDGRVSSQSVDFLNDEQLAELETLLAACNANREKFLGFFKIQELKDLQLTQFAKAKSMLNAKAK